MTIETRNEVLLEGRALDAPSLSHENHGTRFYRFCLQVPRLSGTPDTLPVVLPEALLTGAAGGGPLRLRGQLRSFNNRSGQGSRLVITPQLLVDGYVAQECMPLVLEADIYHKKLQRRKVLDGYVDLYTNRRELVNHPREVRLADYSETLQLPARVDTARVRAIVSTASTGY